MNIADMMGGIRSGLDAVKRLGPAADIAAIFVPGLGAALKIAEGVAEAASEIKGAIDDGRIIASAHTTDELDAILDALSAETKRINAAIQAG